MAAGIADRAWDVADIVRLLEDQESARLEKAKQDRLNAGFAALPSQQKIFSQR